jgi:hypothetical protein
LKPIVLTNIGAAVPGSGCALRAQTRLTVTVLTIACVLGVAHGQTGVGAAYGSRNPAVCKSTKSPASGVPSASQLKDYVRCDVYLGEKANGKTIYLLENLQVEIGKGRPYQDSEKGVSNIDPSQPVYPIRGSYDKYSCAVLVAGGLPNATRGANCAIFKEPRASGICYKTTFGEWGCMMVDVQINTREGQFNMPPPQ